MALISFAFGTAFAAATLTTMACADSALTNQLGDGKMHVCTLAYSKVQQDGSEQCMYTCHVANW
jgi:hypothetical protein